MAKISIVVVSDKGSTDGFYFLQGLMNVGESYATGIANMVTLIKDLCKGGDKIVSLTIHGHGNETGQYIGTDWLDTGTLAQYRASLLELAPLFDADAVVTLGGCNVGHAEALLQQLSDLLGVTLRAGTASQLAFPGVEGGVRTCKLKMCEYGGPGFWDKFDIHVRGDKRFVDK